MGELVRIVKIDNGGDTRGSSFVPPPKCFDFIGTIRDIHIATSCRCSARQPLSSHHREVMWWFMPIIGPFTGTWAQTRKFIGKPFQEPARL